MGRFVNSNSKEVIMTTRTATTKLTALVAMSALMGSLMFPACGESHAEGATSGEISITAQSSQAPPDLASAEPGSTYFDTDERCGKLRTWFYGECRDLDYFKRFV